MNKKFIQIIVQHKWGDDYRSFCICSDSKNNKWELRGYGATPMKATEDVYQRFLDDESFWTGVMWTDETEEYE